MCRQLTFVILLILCLQPSQAANQYFMPGDAFFHTVLTEEVLKGLEKQHPQFFYHRPSFLPFMLCGYTGFDRMEFKDMPPAMKQNLVKAYRELRKSHPLRIEITDEVRIEKTNEGDIQVPTGRKKSREVNGFSVLFYNGDFDRKKFRLGLKYNEDWADQFAASGHKREHAILETLVEMPEAIANEWRDAKQVKPLQAKLPPLNAKNIRTPIQVSGNITAYVLSTRDYKALYRGESGFSFGDKSLVVYEVTAKGIKQLSGRKGHWLVPQGLGK